MAPSPPVTPGENAHSALFTSSSVVTPIIITVSSAAGISIALLLAIVGLTTYRRFRARQAAEERRKSVPQLVITDTSMFPACNLVVNGDADLDKVIASHKPLGKDSRGGDESEGITAQDEYYARPYDVEEEEQCLYLPPKPRPASNLHNQDPEHPHRERGGATRQDTGPPWDPMKCSLQLVDETEINEAVFWWHEFNAASTQPSVDSLSEADDSVSSGSLYSSNSLYHGPSPFKQSAYSSSATLSVLNRITGVEPLPADVAHRRKSATFEPIEEEANESQETLYDKDVLAYCWRVSDDGIYRAPSDSRSTQEKQVDEKSIPPGKPERRSQPKVYPPTDDPIDQKILEYCWRLSDSYSVRSIRDRAIAGSKKRRSMTTTRSVSESSISKSAALHISDPPEYAFVARNDRF